MTIRELMTKEIVFYGWLDYRYKWNRINWTQKEQEEYKKYLNELSDSDMLDTYNRVRDHSNNLD